MASKGDIKKNEIQPKLSRKWDLIGFENALKKNGTFTKLKSNQVYQSGSFPVIDQGENENSGYIDNPDLIYQGKTPVVIFGDHTRNVKFVDFSFAVGADGTKILSTIDQIIPKFFYYYLKTLKIPNFGYSRHYKVLKEVDVPLPSLPEQQRIIAKLDSFFAHLEQVKQCLEQIPVLLKQFRQAVLTQAVTGKLTEEWREMKTIETGYELLTKIKSKRIEIYNQQNEILIKEGKRKVKFPILDVNIENEINFETPESWAFCTIGEVAEVCNGSTPSRPIKEYWNGDIPWVSSGLVQNNRITNTNEYLTKLGLEKSSVKVLPKGTVLMAMIGEGKTRGQSAILDLNATINQNIAAIVLEHKLVLSEYMQYWLLVNYENNRVMGNGTGPQALNCQRVRELPFNLAPHEEQIEIVNIVESLFSKADAIEARYKKLKQNIDQLPKAILAKAFRGEM